MTYSKMISTFTAIAVTATGMFLVAPPASAKERPVIVTAPTQMVVRRISYADLNLASASGEKRLHNRVGGAVRDLCNEATGGRDGSMSAFFALQSCGNDAWDQANPQIARAVLRAHQIASTGSTSIAAAAISITIK